MSIRAAIYDLLNDVDSRVHALAAPQEETNPYAVWEIRREPIRVQESIILEEITLTLNIYANLRDDALTLATSYFDGLEAKTGSYSNKTLIACTWSSESEDYISELDKWNVSQEYNLKFE